MRSDSPRTYRYCNSWRYMWNFWLTKSGNWTNLFQKSNGSLNDLCLVSNSTRFKNLDCWLSDWHNFICIPTKLFASHQKPNVITYRPFKKIVDDYFIYDLYHLLESLNLYNNDSINTCFQNFVDCMDDIMNYHAPWKTKTIRKNSVPYMNSELWKMMYKRNMMRSIKNKHPCLESYECYRILRNQCVKLGMRSKKQYFTERCEGGPKTNISGILSNPLLAQCTLPIQI